MKKCIPEIFAVLIDKHVYIAFEIKLSVGDWCLIPFPGKYKYVLYHIQSIEDLKEHKEHNNPNLKIIATDDTNLFEYAGDFDYKQKIFKIPAAFVEHFHKNPTITGIDVEFEMAVNKGKTCTGCEEPSWCITCGMCEQHVMKDTNASGDNFDFWQEHNPVLVDNEIQISLKF